MGLQEENKEETMKESKKETNISDSAVSDSAVSESANSDSEASDLTAPSKDLSRLQVHPVWAKREVEFAGGLQNKNSKKVSLELQEEADDEKAEKAEKCEKKPEMKKPLPKAEAEKKSDKKPQKASEWPGDTQPMFREEELEERIRQRKMEEQRREPRKEAKANPKQKPTNGRRRMTQAERARYLKMQKKKKRRNKIYTIFMVIFIFIFLLSGYQLIRAFKDYKQGGNEYEEIRTSALTISEGKNEKTAMARDFYVNFDALLAQNPDTVAWIRFEKPSVISYPVVKSWDNREYLTQTFSINDNKLGAIFMDMNNSEPLADRNTLIYGHNMKIGGEMFSQLDSYADEAFCKENPYFYLYTMDGKVSYCKVFSAGVVKEDSPRYRLDFESDDDFQEYLNMCVNESNYKVDAELNARCKIVTLSTCTNRNSDERFIVQAVITRQERTEGSKATAEEDNQEQSEGESPDMTENGSQDWNEGGY